MPQRAPTFRPHAMGTAPHSYPAILPQRPNAYRRGYTDQRWRGRPEQEGLGGIRGFIYRRDGGRCQACGVLCIPKAKGSDDGDRRLWPHVDHIVPKTKGGTDDVSNLQLLCGSCNAAKQDREEAV